MTEGTIIIESEYESTKPASAYNQRDNFYEQLCQSQAEIPIEMNCYNVSNCYLIYNLT